MLLAVGVLSLALAFLPGLGRMARDGTSWGLGNRETRPEGEAPWIGRAERAHRNLLENLPLFTILVLVADLTGRADDVTAAACVVFFVTRVLHALVYVRGIVVVRTLVFYLSLAAEGVIAWRILLATSG